MIYSNSSIDAIIACELDRTGYYGEEKYEQEEDEDDG